MSVSKSWQKKFDFFDEFGLPKSETYLPAFKALSFTDRALMNLNLGAFFLGFIYFFIIGRPKQAIAVFIYNTLIFVAVYAVLFLLGDAVSASLARGITLGCSVGIAAINMQAANICYYLKMVKNEPDSFSPYKHIRWF